MLYLKRVGKIFAKICSDKELAALDKEMAQAYKKARASLRALRDERGKKHKIKLEAVNDTLLNDFINKYEQEY